MPDAVVYILADKDDSGTKLIFFLIVAAIWLISAAAGAIKKKQEELRREQLRSQLETSLPRLPPPVPTPPLASSRVSQPTAVQQRRNALRQRTTQAKPQARRAAREVPKATFSSAEMSKSQGTQLETAPALPQSRDLSATEIGSREAVSRPSMSRALHDLLRPPTLRKQFILTEILQPPLALREDHLG
jgi:hypothetical protein